MITVFMTAFYMFRVIFLTFGGEYRGGETGGHGVASGHEKHDAHREPHESPVVMLFPMVVLALFAIGAGWSFWAGGAAKFLGQGSYAGLAGAHWEQHGFFALFSKVGEEPLPLIALAVALAGISLAYVIYSKKWISAEKIGQIFAPIYTLLSRKYYFDELYEQVLVVRVLVNGIFYQIQQFDTYVVDGIVNGLGKITVTASGTLRKLQTGQLQSYGLAIMVGVLIIMAVFFAYR
jgi:NADH-quinone oxidoreductase subunit L